MMRSVFTIAVTFALASPIQAQGFLELGDIEGADCSARISSHELSIEADGITAVLDMTQELYEHLGHYGPWTRPRKMTYSISPSNNDGYQVRIMRLHIVVRRNERLLLKEVSYGETDNGWTNSIQLRCPLERPLRLIKDRFELRERADKTRRMD